MYGALAVGGAVDGVIVNCNKASVAGKLQIGFDKTEAHGDRFAERRQGIFRSVTGGSAVRDQ